MTSNCVISPLLPLYTVSAAQHLTRVRHVEHALLFPSRPCFGVNLPVIGIAQVDAPAAFLWNTRSQRHRDARRFDTAFCVVGTRSLNVRAMCQNAPRHVL